MGRSPGLAIAYMYWFLDAYNTLDGAYEGLTSIRPCGPKKESIRGATCDLLAAIESDGKVEPLKRELEENEGVVLSIVSKERIKRAVRAMLLSTSDETDTKPWWKIW